MSVHWFSLLKDWIPSLRTHFVSLALPTCIEDPELISQYSRRSMQVRSLEILPLESIVRGCKISSLSLFDVADLKDLTGSAFGEYQRSQTVHGIPMSAGLRESEKFERPLWTPSTKAEQGEKDENISPLQGLLLTAMNKPSLFASQAKEIVGSGIARRVEQLSLEIYSKVTHSKLAFRRLTHVFLIQAAEFALERGIIIADSKFEFGIDRSDDTIVLVDEVLTPDSSRFWPAAQYEVGKAQKSLDKVC